MQVWIDLDIVAYLRKQVSCDVSDFILWDESESAAGASQCMFNTELCTTDAFVRQSLRLPTISQVDCVLDISLVQLKACSSIGQTVS